MQPMLWQSAYAESGLKLKYKYISIKFVLNLLWEYPKVWFVLYS